MPIIAYKHKQLADGGSWNSGWNENTTWYVNFLQQWPNFIPKQVQTYAVLSKINVFDDDDTAASAYIKGWNDGTFHGWFDVNNGPTALRIDNAREIWFGLAFYGAVFVQGTFTIFIWG